jgi:glucosamine kinase
MVFIMESPIKYLIGIDGGGTSCRAALKAAPDAPCIYRSGGPANVSSFDVSMVNIVDTIRQLLRDAGLEERDLRGASVHLGLAGVLGAAQARAVQQELGKRLPIARISVSDDQATTLAGALGCGDGAVAAIGTGSFLGRRSGGAQKTLGGWGFHLGDQASGAWLGAGLLRQVMMAVDGTDHRTGLTDAVLREFGDEPAAIVAFAGRAQPVDFASFAPRVLSAAAEGDAVAVDLMRSGAAYLLRALGAIGWRSGEALCLLGGIGPSYAQWLPADVVAALRAPLGNALDGALAMASQIEEQV